MSRVYEGRIHSFAELCTRNEESCFKSHLSKCICLREAVICAYKGDIPVAPTSVAEPFCDVFRLYIPNLNSITPTVSVLLEPILWHSWCLAVLALCACTPLRLLRTFQPQEASSVIGIVVTLNPSFATSQLR